MKLSAFEGRRVAVLGYGREGRAVCGRLAGLVRELTVFTGDRPVDCDPGHSGVRFEAGLPAADRLAGFDVVVRSPGISPYLPALKQAAAAGVRFTTGTAIWFAEHPNAYTVVVTGTKGKSTTAALTAHLLEAAGVPVRLAGNIGVPLLEHLHPDNPPAAWVLELSSFQLYELGARPSLAVVLNLSPEHLDWHGSEARYYADKLGFLAGLDGGDVWVNGADANLRAHLPGGCTPRLFNTPDTLHARDGAAWDGDRRLFPLDAFALPGAHNRVNLCAALAVVKALGRDPAGVQPALADFEALPHRLCSLGRRDGVEYVDDSISTTPRASRAALACYPDRPVTLLLGGYDRGLDWGELRAALDKRDRVRVCTFGAAGERIARELGGIAGPEADASFDDAVDLARAVTPTGGVVLLSPGAPSFDAFEDYADRGRRFARLAGFD